MDPTETVLALPDALAARPRDADGHVVPFYAVQVDLQWPVDIDPQKVLQCYRGQLCGACGKRLDYWLVFLGGTENRRLRSFPHPPMHRTCAEYLVATDPPWSVSAVERTLAYEKKAAELGIKGVIDGVLYVTRGFEFNHRTRMFEPHAAKEDGAHGR
jgi:hypothetical protein